MTVEEVQQEKVDLIYEVKNKSNFVKYDAKVKSRDQRDHNNKKYLANIKK